MKTQWMRQQGSEALLIFFSGWGQDPEPFRKITSDIFDVLIVYDYRSVPGVFPISTENYKQTYIIAWSMGVWVANEYFPELIKQATESIAINGTGQPIHDQSGIPESIYQGTLDHFSEKTRDRFFLRMCGGRSELQHYNMPQRTVQDQQEELVELQSAVQRSEAQEPVFQKAIITEQDLIIPTNNQQHYWQQFPQTEITTIPGAHYAFTGIVKWEQFTTLVTTVC